MNKKALLLEEINHMPENIVDEVIDFVQFLKGKKIGRIKKIIQLVTERNPGQKTIFHYLVHKVFLAFVLNRQLLVNH